MRVLVSILSLNLLLAGAALAVPRYSAQYGQSCHLCHVDPAGGGLRTEYGSQFFAGTELPGRGLAQDQLDQLKTRLGDRVEFGLDFRWLAVQESQAEDPATSLAKHELGSFLLMQGDLYLGLKVRENVRVVLEKGLRGDATGFALLEGLPGHGSLKVGSFLPAFGWRWADHDTAVRQALGYGAGQTDSGLELEFHPDHFSVTLGLGNDSPGMLDGDRGKALTTRVLWQGDGPGAVYGAGVAARVSDRAPAPSRTTVGLLLAASRGPLSWTAEAVRMEADEVEGLAWSQEAAFTVRRGWQLLLVHDFLDPDLEHESGFDQRLRLGLDWLPVPGVAVRGGLSRLEHDEGEATDEWLQADLQLHLFM